MMKKMTEMCIDLFVFARLVCLFLDSNVELDLECSEYKHYLNPTYVEI